MVSSSSIVNAVVGACITGIGFSCHLLSFHFLSFLFPPGASAAPPPPQTPEPSESQAPPPPSADLPPHMPISFPALSPTMSQGNIVSWSKKQGDSVSPGDVLCSVETDKSVLDWEAQEEGFIAKILMPDGSKDIPVGSVVAVLVEEEVRARGKKAQTEKFRCPPSMVSKTASVRWCFYGMCSLRLQNPLTAVSKCANTYGSVDFGDHWFSESDRLILARFGRKVSVF